MADQAQGLPDTLTLEQVQQMQRDAQAKQKPAGKKGLPDTLPSFFPQLTDEQKQQYLSQPGTMGPEVGKEIISAAPQIGATALSLFIPPLGPVADVLMGMSTAAAGGFGGSITRSEYEKRGQEPGAPKDWGEEWRRARDEGLGQALIEGGSRVVTGALGARMSPEDIYRRSLRPSASLGWEEQREIARTGVRERIPLSEGGAGKLDKKIEDLNNDIAQLIASSPANIPPSEYVTNIQARLNILRKKVLKDATDGRKMAAQINGMERQFLINHGNVQPVTQLNPQTGRMQIIRRPQDMRLSELRRRAQPMTTGDAQAIKKETYRQIRLQRSQLAGPTAVPGWTPGTVPAHKLEAREEMARAMRQVLGDIYPNLHNLNERDGRLIALDKAINQFLARNETSHHRLSSWAAVWAMIEASKGDLTEAVRSGILSLIGEALESPEFRSRIAIALGTPVGQVASRFVREVPAGAARYLLWAGDQAKPGEEPVLEPPTGEEGGGRGGRAGMIPQGGTGGRGAPGAGVEYRVTHPTDLPNWRPEWKQALNNAAAQQGVPLGLLLAVANQETAGDPNAVSPQGAQGLMQLMPPTARQFQATNPFDPIQNINASARYLKWLLNQPQYAGQPALVLAAYNWGPGNLASVGNTLYRAPQETKDYVRNGMRIWAFMTNPKTAGALVGDQR